MLAVVFAASHEKVSAKRSHFQPDMKFKLAAFFFTYFLSEQNFDKNKIFPTRVKIFLFVFLGGEIMQQGRRGDDHLDTICFQMNEHTK